MGEAAIEQWFPYAFPFLFVGMWIVVTTGLGLMAGWFRLQQEYPDLANEGSLLRLGGQSGSMGFGVGMSGILTLQAYPSGLGVSISRLFGPFQKPIKVPWSEIEAQSSTSFFLPMAKLQLGRLPSGTLKISARSWMKLVEAAQASNTTVTQISNNFSVSRQSTARAMFLQWAAVTALAAAFFYFAPRLSGAANALPLGIAIGLPAVVVGLGQLVRYFRES